MAEKYTFLVIKYPKADTAMAALAALRDLSKKKVVKLNDAVAITKTKKNKIKLHQTKDDSAGKGFIKGGMIGIIFAALFGPVGWIMTGALAGTALGMFDRGVKNKLLKELGKNMTPSESAVAILVEHADWQKAVDSMREHNFQGQIIISEIVQKDLAEVEKALKDEKTVASVPEEMEVPAPVEELVAKEEPEVEPAVQPIKSLAYIEGIGKVYSKKLHTAGITNVDELLEKGSTPKGRKEIIKATGISEKRLLRWVNMADLYRVQSIGKEYADLLEAAGVDTVPELAQRAPASLLEKMTAANAQKKLVRRLPTISQVENWVAQAKSLPRVITY
jgi:uncharacterized membrane protein